MVNEDRVILMTKMAAFEKHHAKHDMNIVNYFRTDYIGFQVLKAVIAGTISFMFILGIYFFYNFEMIMSDVYTMDLLETGKSILIAYVVGVGLYAMACYGISAYRYSKAKKELKGFYQNLRILDKMRSSRVSQND